MEVKQASFSVQKSLHDHVGTTRMQEFVVMVNLTSSDSVCVQIITINVQ